MHRSRLIHQKLNHNLFCGPLLAEGLFKIPFPTKNFLRKFFNKMHRFRLMQQKLSQKRFFVPLLVAPLCKIQFPTKNFAFSNFDWVKPWIGLKNQLSNFAISFVYIWSTLKKKSSAENVCMFVCMCVCVCVCKLSIFCLAITRKRLHRSLWNSA